MDFDGKKRLVKANFYSFDGCETKAQVIERVKGLLRLGTYNPEDVEVLDLLNGKLDLYVYSGEMYAVLGDESELYSDMNKFLLFIKDICEKWDNNKKMEG